MFNVAIGIVWQTALVVLPIYIVLMKGFPIALSLAVIMITSYILKKSWYDKLPAA